MQSGIVMEREVINVLKNDIIAYFNKPLDPDDKREYPEDLPVAVLQGLYKIVSGSENTSIVSCMFQYSFPMWLLPFFDLVSVCLHVFENYINQTKYAILTKEFQNHVFNHLVLNWLRLHNLSCLYLKSFMTILIELAGVDIRLGVFIVYMSALIVFQAFLRRHCNLDLSILLL